MRWLFVDRVIECEPGNRIITEKTFPEGSDFFADHFAGMPLVPGVLLIETIAQAGGRCLSLATTTTLPILGTVRSAKFYRQVKGGEVCRAEVQIESQKDSHATARGTLTVNGERACVVEFLYAFVPRPAEFKHPSCKSLEQSREAMP